MKKRVKGIRNEVSKQNGQKVSKKKKTTKEQSKELRNERRKSENTELSNLVLVHPQSFCCLLVLVFLASSSLFSPEDNFINFISINLSVYECTTGERDMDCKEEVERS